MKTTSADLLALFDSGAPINRVELIAIGPCRNGAHIYAITGDLPMTFGGNVYDPSKYGVWSRGNITTRVGLESNSVDLSVLADNQVPVYFPGTSNGALLVDGIKFGLLGKAPVSIYVAYSSEYLSGYGFGSSVGPGGGSLVETLFIGQVGPVPQAGITKATITVHDLLYLLNIQIPPRVMQATCSHVLYDAGCTLAAATFTRSGAVSAVNRPFEFTTTLHISPATAAGTFTQGVLTWTSGQNNGLSSHVRRWTAGTGSDTFDLDVGPIFPIQAGDTFTIQQGCDHTFATCQDLQGSSANAYRNYGGQPNVPVPETAIA